MPTIILLLGRLYFLNKDLIKAENEFKTAVSLDPSSEEAITNLAYLYNDEGDNKRAAEVLRSVPERGARPRSMPRWAAPTSSKKITRKPLPLSGRR